MRKSFLFIFRNISFLVLLLISNIGFSSEHAENTQQTNIGDLHIKLGKIPENPAGFIVSVYRTQNTFLKKAEQVFYYTPDQLIDKVLIVEKLAFGELAVSVSADMNGNRELDTRVFGIPAEPVGFANNPKARFGPPKFEDSVFRHDRHPHHVPLELKSL